MLINPFTPSEIASQPEDFYGRRTELAAVETSLLKGSVAIQGAIGIGKSSLLARARLLMEGHHSEYHAKCVVGVADKDIQNIDQAARLLLECLIDVDERRKKVAFKFGSLIEVSSTEIIRNFAEGRHLAVLKRLVEREVLDSWLPEPNLLLLAIDEADKCPVPLARLVRSISTHVQHRQINRVRFLLAGVSPFFQKMVDEDPGVNRVFYKTTTLQPMSPEEATELVETKLQQVADDALAESIDLKIDPEIVPRVVTLAGGHPHILQLLGSHLIQHENDDPDNVIDSRDLMTSLRRICFEDRARIYDSTLHMLELEAKSDDLNMLLQLAPFGFPTRIPRRRAADNVSKASIKWFVEHNILSVASPTEYGLVDEFIRIRIYLSEASSIKDSSAIEAELINEGIVIDEESSSDLEDDELFPPGDEGFDDRSSDESEDVE